MLGSIYVMELPQYEAWLNRGAPDQNIVQQGAQLFRTLGCSGCHMGSTTVRAPRLEGLFGKQVALQDGQVVTADEQYIRDSILLPNLQIVAGYAPVMPTFQGHVSEEELLQLISYIKSLGTASPPEEANR